MRVWKKNDSIDYYPDKMKPEQFGVNGSRYAALTHYLYYTATAKKLFMRIAVDPDSLEAKGDPEVVVAGRMSDQVDAAPARSSPGLHRTIARVAEGHEVVESLCSFAQPAGTTLRHVYESLRDTLLDDLRAALPVDVVLLFMHGVMVAHGYDDCEGDTLARVRALVGPAAAVGLELDLHCHLTEQMRAHATAIVLYKEYPHTDIADRAPELYRICIDAAANRVRPVMALHDCRMIGTFRPVQQPVRGFVDRMKALEGRDGILSVPGERTIRFRLKAPFPLLPEALGKLSGPVPFMMPERLAQTDPQQQIREVVGSGPFRFLPDEWVAGAGAAYARSDGYVPRNEKPDGAAGGKVVNVSRVEWHTIPDPATAMAAMQAGQMDWLEQPTPDLLPTVAGKPGLTAVSSSRIAAVGTGLDDAARSRVRRGRSGQVMLIGV